MKINTNRWNVVRYSFYASFYDVFIKLVNKSRKKSIDSLEIAEGDKILIIGAGTGLDLKFLSKNCEITAIDITPLMIKKINKRNDKLKLNLKTHVMDGQELKFPNSHFDFVILHLILAIIPDPEKCIKESERVLKDNGGIAVYDKFLKKHKKSGIFRTTINFFSKILFSDINRKFENILQSVPSLKVIHDYDADFNGFFRRIKLKKTIYNNKNH